ncbi:MAG: hypothetical protein J6X11_13985 [Treponema sp.]|nr:hypothetical protein [Treponema sp.]
MRKFNSGFTYANHIKHKLEAQEPFPSELFSYIPCKFFLKMTLLLNCLDGTVGKGFSFGAARTPLRSLFLTRTRTPPLTVYQPAPLVSHNAENKTKTGGLAPSFMFRPDLPHSFRSKQKSRGTTCFSRFRAPAVISNAPKPLRDKAFPTSNLLYWQPVHFETEYHGERVLKVTQP